MINRSLLLTLVSSLLSLENIILERAGNDKQENRAIPDDIKIPQSRDFLASLQ